MLPSGFLIVALSGRILARAAARAGRPAVGVDAFADRDTCELARAWAQAPLDSDWNMDADAMLAAAERLCPGRHCHGLVYGSGFEARPDLLRALAATRPLLGNRPEVLDVLANPIRFAAMLDELGIPHPVTVPTRPADPEGWLCKQAGACGGVHVRPLAEARDTDARSYFQRRVAGDEWSLLFLANGEEAMPIGFNRPLAPSPGARHPWRYAGAVRQPHGPERQTEAVLEAAAALTQRLGLKGLNGLDFMVGDQGWSLLELNPRPTATVELWDRAPLPPLFDLHVQACQGRLPTHLPEAADSAATALVYADRPLQVPADFAWPRWCADLPEAGQAMTPGDPVCSVHAEHGTAAAAERAVLARREEILHLLEQCQPRSRGDIAAVAAHPGLLTTL